MDNTFILVINFTGFKKIRLELVRVGGFDISPEVVVRPERRAVDFSFDSDLDTVLIESIDKVLKRKRIDTTSLKEVKIVGEVNPNSSAYKIAQTWIEALKTFKNL